MLRYSFINGCPSVLPHIHSIITAVTDTQVFFSVIKRITIAVIYKFPLFSASYQTVHQNMYLPTICI